MAHLFGMARIGRDAEIRRTQSGEAVCSLSLAFNYYSKDAENGRAVQWVEGSLWGKRAESLAQYLKKGTSVAVTIEDIHIEEYQGKNGTGTKLTGRVVAIELGSKGDSAGGGAPAPAPAPRAAAPRPAPRPAPAPAPSHDDMDDDIPF